MPDQDWDVWDDFEKAEKDEEDEDLPGGAVVPRKPKPKRPSGGDKVEAEKEFVFV